MTFTLQALSLLEPVQLQLFWPAHQSTEYLGGQADYINAIGVLSTVAHPIQRLGIPVDVTLLNGTFTLANPDGTAVPVTDETECP